METEPPKKLKVFICWSGERSKIVAEALRKWLPRVIQATEPFMSEYIDKGAPWSERLDEALQSAHIGILCLTKENQHEPWISFEAGALYITLKLEKVCPYLLDVAPSDVRYPLAKFQAAQATKDDTHRLVMRMNKAMADIGLPLLDTEILSETFHERWEALEKSLSDARALPVTDKTQKEVTRSSTEILSEVLALLRAQARSSATMEQRLDGLERALSGLFIYQVSPDDANVAKTPPSGRLFLHAAPPTARAARATGAAYSFSPSPPPPEASQSASPSPDADEQ
jgi:TIR domain